MAKRTRGALDAAAVLAKLDDITDPVKRVDVLERALAKVPDPHELVEPWGDAMWKSPLIPADQVAARIVAECNARTADHEFLAAAGKFLDDRSCEDEAIEVLQLARRCGSTDGDALCVLGRLLCLQGDADAGVPLLEFEIEDAPEWARPRQELAMHLRTTDPARALALLEPIADQDDEPRSDETRAMLYEQLARPDDARAAIARMLESFDTELEARESMSRWHFFEFRYDRALVHARRLDELLRTLPDKTLRKISPSDRESYDETILQAYRLGGAFAELVPEIRERFATVDPSPTLATEILAGLTALRPIPLPVLARRCAQLLVTHARDANDLATALDHEIDDAELAASLGDLGALEAVADRLATTATTDPRPYARLVDAFLVVDRLDRASTILDAGLAIDPACPELLAAQFDIALELGDADLARRCTERYLEVAPRSHVGPEHLARISTRTGIFDVALEQSRKALLLGPYCQNAWLARAEALLLTGDHAAARQCTTRALQILAADPGDEISIIDAAAAGDLERLDRELAARISATAAKPHAPDVMRPFADYYDRVRAAARSVR
jgi:tetratricopeptide (TPR) repeat protein